jgi:hypothetical protein
MTYLSVCILLNTVDVIMIFGVILSRRFHLLLRFLYLIHNEGYEKAACRNRRLYILGPKLDHLHDIFGSDICQ